MSTGTGRTSLGLAEVLSGDYRWYETILEKLSKVTLDDLERVHKTYLVDKNRTVGLVPAGPRSGIGVS